MKEAVVYILIIPVAAVIALGYTHLINEKNDNQDRKVQCQTLGGTWADNKCFASDKTIKLPKLQD